jgi:hypothetical protein
MHGCMDRCWYRRRDAQVQKVQRDDRASRHSNRWCSIVFECYQAKPIIVCMLSTNSSNNRGCWFGSVALIPILLFKLFPLHDAYGYTITNETLELLTLTQENHNAIVSVNDKRKQVGNAPLAAYVIALIGEYVIQYTGALRNNTLTYCLLLGCCCCLLFGCCCCCLCVPIEMKVASVRYHQHSFENASMQNNKRMLLLQR